MAGIMDLDGPLPRGDATLDRTLVLQEDAALAAEVPAERREHAVRSSIAAVQRRRIGSWAARHDAQLGRSGFGLLILDGLLIRRMGVDGRFGAELLAAGDLLRPWQHDGEHAVLPFEMTWRVVAPVRMAVLDRRWAARMAPHPEIGAALAGRALERSRRLATLMAIAQQPRLEHRLRLLFWEIADRHGKVRPEGVRIDLPLTHEVLSQLAAARRSSVSTALGRLMRTGTLARAGRGWLLQEPPPHPGERAADGASQPPSRG
jgi:CRP/FNR family cyclic AMP-dependent transcriptional regulator